MLLNKSKYAKALEHQSLNEAFASLPDVDNQFLEGLTQFLIEQRPNIVQEYTKTYEQMEESEENTYAKKMASLTTTLCRNYEVLLIK